VFRRELIQIGNIEVFLEAIKIASACNKVLRKRFLNTDTIGLIPMGGYGGNVNYSKKSLIWLFHIVKLVGEGKILPGRNGRDYRLPELSHINVDGFCPETRRGYEFISCYYHGHTCHLYRDVSTMSVETVAVRYVRTMVGIEQITREDYLLEVQWEGEFD